MTQGGGRDSDFQRLMAVLGEAKAAYDLAVREVTTEPQEGDTFRVSAQQYERWRDASHRLREADEAVLALLARSAA